jgi:hypothetical protein
VATIIPLHSLLFLHFHHYPLVHSYSLPSTIILINPKLSLSIQLYSFAFNTIPSYSKLSICVQHYPLPCIQYYPFAFNIIPL